MRYKVQLPEYPCSHIVTGFTTGRSAGGNELLLAEAAWVRPGFGRPRPVCDLVTLMYLHDACHREGGPQNPARLYGRAKRNQALAAERIAGATVEALPDPAGSPICPACGRPDLLKTVGTLPSGFVGCACCAQPWTPEEILRNEG